MLRTLFGLLIVGCLCACEEQFPATRAEHRAAEEAYDSELLRASLEQIEAWHVRNETGLADSLNEGAPVPSIVSDFERTNCQPTEEMKVLWSWRNGGVGTVPFVWYHDFLSLDEAISEYTWLRRNPLVSWDPNYIPLFAFEGEWYAGYCGKGSELAGPVVHYFIEDEPRVSFANITTFLSTMAEALQTGAVLWKDGAMVEDIRELRRIHRNHNQGYEFPYFVPDDS